MIKNYCETCKKELTLEEWTECFEANHDLRTSGLLVIADVDRQPGKTNAVYGIAAEDIKKGQVGKIQI